MKNKMDWENLAVHSKKEALHLAKCNSLQSLIKLFKTWDE